MRVWNRNPAVAFVLVLIVYCICAYIYALIKPIWCDEIWAMIPAGNLAFHGFLGMGDQTTLILPTLHSESHIYWYPPLAYWSMAGWFKVAGYSLLTARCHSIVWGCILLTGVYYLGQDWNWNGFKYRSDGATRMFLWSSLPWTGIWAVLICTLDYNFLASSDARPEMMCAALGVWAIATRSAWFAAAACLVHPFGIMYPIALACIKRRIEWLPYLVAAGVWGVYIAQDPVLWWHTQVNSFIVHFIQVADAPGPGVYLAFGTGWRLVLLGTYVACAWLTAWRNRDIRWCLLWLVLPAFFATRTAYYMPHAIPWLALCVAIQMRRWPWLAGIIALELAFAVTTLLPLWTWDGVFNLR